MLDMMAYLSRHSSVMVGMVDMYRRRVWMVSVASRCKGICREGSGFRARWLSFSWILGA